MVIAVVQDTCNTCHGLVAIVDGTHVGSATESFKDLVRVAQENTNQTADVLVEDQQQPPLD